MDTAADESFNFAKQSIENNGIVVVEEDIVDDTMDRAAAKLTKTFNTASDHATFLQHQRKKGRIGTVVTNPSNGESINTRSFGTFSDHREKNNRLRSELKSQVYFLKARIKTLMIK